MLLTWCDLQLCDVNLRYHLDRFTIDLRCPDSFQSPIYLRDHEALLLGLHDILRTYWAQV